MTATSRRLVMHGRTARKEDTISRARYDALAARLEDLEDQLDAIRLNQSTAVRNDTPSADALSDELMGRLLDGHHPIEVWRAHRGYTLARLEVLSGVPASYISEIVNGKKPGSADALSRLAAALDVSLDDVTTWIGSASLPEAIAIKPVVSQAPSYNPETKRVRFFGGVKRDVAMITVSREVLEDLAGENDLDEISAVRTAQKNLTLLCKIAARKYLAHAFHPDGYILILPEDLV